MSPSETADMLKMLAPICRAEGVRRLRLADGTELEFGAAPIDPKSVVEFQKAFEHGQPTAEDVLRWSEPGYVPSNERGAD